MTTNNLIVRLLLLAGSLGLIILAWYLFVSHAYIQLVMPSGADRALVIDAATRSIVATRKDSGWLHLPTGTYTVTYYKGETILDVQARRIGPFSFQTVRHEDANQAGTQKPLGFLQQPADLVTPVGRGYVYLNKANRGVIYADASGSTDISSRLRLGVPSDQSAADYTEVIYDTALNIESIAPDTAVVTTTRAAYLIKGLADIVELPIYNGKVSLNFTSSAYDSKSHSLFLIAAYNHDIYRYRLDQPKKPLETVYHNDLDLNRLAAGNGKLVAYFDAVPSTQPEVVAEYGKTRQLEPLVIDTETMKVTRRLSDFKPATFVAVSDSGRFVAIKKKLETTITIYDLESGGILNLPSYDTSGADWLGDTFYLARDQAIWTFDATNRNGALVKLASIDTPVSSLRAAKDGTILTTTAGVTAILAPLNQARPAVTLGSPPARAEGQLYQYFISPYSGDQ